MNPIMRSDVEIEKDVLGALLRFPQRMHDSGVSERHFYDELNLRCFRSLVERGCSPSSIAAVIDDASILEDICERSWSDAGLKQHLEYLSSLAEIREAGQASRSLYEALKDADATEASGMIGNAISKLAAATSGRSRKFYDGIDADEHLQSKTGERIPIFIEGMFVRRSEVVFIGAPPKTGKTTLATQIARHFVAGYDGLNVMTTMEMTPKEIFEKDVQRAAGRRIWEDENPKEFAYFAKIVRDWYRNDKPGKLLLDYKGSSTLSEIRSRALQAQAETGRKLRCLIIDQFDKLVAEKSSSDPRVSVKSLSVGLNNLAKELDVAIICLIQINARKEKDKADDGNPKPFTKDDIFGTSAPEQDAGQIWVLQKIPGTSWEGGVLRCQMSIEAGRNGGTDDVYFIDHIGSSSTFRMGF